MKNIFDKVFKFLELVQTWIIHILGGVTLREYYKFHQEGRMHAYENCKEYAKNLYGINSEEWCKKMYDCIDDLYEKARKDFDE